jgi:hypothetical protein
MELFLLNAEERVKNELECFNHEEFMEAVAAYALTDGLLN